MAIEGAGKDRLSNRMQIIVRVLKLGRRIFTEHLGVLLSEEF